MISSASKFLKMTLKVIKFSQNQKKNFPKNLVEGDILGTYPPSPSVGNPALLN
jgi:hypothetical protein